MVHAIGSYCHPNIRVVFRKPESFHILSAFLGFSYSGRVSSSSSYSTKENTKMNIDCPFCPYSDDDYRYVIEHVECYHSEMGESPFAVKEEADKTMMVKDHYQTGAKASDAISEDEYVECDCGELVVLSEFASHIALHESEQTITDVVTPATILYPSKSPEPIGEGINVAFMGKPETRASASSEGKSSFKRRSHSGHRKSHRPVHSFIDALLGPSPSSSSPHAVRAKHQSPRRLGVGTALLDFISLLVAN